VGGKIWEALERFVRMWGPMLDDGSEELYHSTNRWRETIATVTPKFDLMMIILWPRNPS